MVFGILREKNIDKEIKDILRTLNQAKIKLSIAWNFKYNLKRKKKFLFSVTVLTALHGVPLTSDSMGDLYINDARKDVKSVQKKLRKIFDNARTKPYFIKIRDPLEEAMVKADKLVELFNKGDLENVAKYIEELENNMRLVLFEITS